MGDGGALAPADFCTFRPSGRGIVASLSTSATGYAARRSRAARPSPAAMTR